MESDKFSNNSRTYNYDSIESLDSIIEVFSKYSDDERKIRWKNVSFSRKIFSKHKKILKKIDPFDGKYKNAVAKFYNFLHKNEYNTANEGFSIADIRKFVYSGFPYCTESASFVGDYLMAYGFIIRTMNLPAGAKILDVGSGPGSLTTHLIQMGYDLTCVDVNQYYVDLIKEIAHSLGKKVKAIRFDMSEMQINEKFDAVIFMESFHHTLNPEKVISIVGNNLNDDGKIIFAAEPIVPDDDENVPYPWGPRLDFESINSIRKFGWIEMGYQESFFKEMLFRKGFHFRRVRSNETWWGDVIECKQIQKVKLNVVYTFGIMENGISMLSYGWSIPEPEFTWSDSSEAILAFFMENCRADSVNIKITILVFLCAKNKEQLIKVYNNERHVDDWKIKGNQLITITKVFPINCGNNDSLQRIKFKILDPKSPKDLGLSSDIRKLGIALKNISFF